MKTVLVVDDFKTNTIVFSGVLRRSGYDVLEANSGAEALSYFDGRTIDLMVSDFNMPGMTGAQLVRNVKSIGGYQNLPVIILSTEKGDKVRQEARDAGAYGWMTKPMDIEKFLKIVKNILNT